MELILIHVLPGHCHSESRRGAVVPATAFPSGRQPVAAQTAQTSLPALSLSLSLSLLPRLKFGAQNANTIKCWVIAFTSMGDN